VLCFRLSLSAHGGTRLVPVTGSTGTTTIDVPDYDNFLQKLERNYDKFVAAVRESGTWWTAEATNLQRLMFEAIKVVREQCRLSEQMEPALKRIAAQTLEGLMVRLRQIAHALTRHEQLFRDRVRNP